MTDFDKYWQRLVAANPKLSDPEVRVSMSSAAVKAMIEKAFAEGKESKSKMESALGGLFGKGPFG